MNILLQFGYAALCIVGALTAYATFYYTATWLSTESLALRHKCEKRMVIYLIITVIITAMVAFPCFIKP